MTRSRTRSESRFSKGFQIPNEKSEPHAYGYVKPHARPTHPDCPQALTISEIASCDWPDQYPDLLSSIIGLLSSGSPDMVHGAMRLFTEFVRNDLSEDQLLPVMRELVPVLLTILGDSKVCFSPHHPSACSHHSAAFNLHPGWLDRCLPPMSHIPVYG